MKFFLAAMLLATPALLQGKDPSADRIAALLASTTGGSREAAYKVRNVSEEYMILRARHLRPTMQSLIIGDDHHPYDTIEVLAEDGSKTTLWFDIASFYGKEFGF